MEIIILPDAEGVGIEAAKQVAQVLAASTTPVLGLATGSSPLQTYRQLRVLADAGVFDPGIVTGFALDEYVGLAQGHPESYVSVIRREATECIGFDPAKIHVLDGRAVDLGGECAAYERAIADAGGIDVQLLGIGRNGHIGFNEPGSSLASRTRVQALTPGTRADNARFFDSVEQVPTLSVTQGLGTIMEARKLVLVAQGSAKADAVAGAAEGPVNTSCPASVVQLHPHAVLVLDEAAAAKLTLVGS